MRQLTAVTLPCMWRSLYVHNEVVISILNSTLVNESEHLLQGRSF